MANKDNSDKTPGQDVSYNSYQARLGLDMDSNINQIDAGKYSYALNAQIENFDGNSFSLQNESGNEFCLQFPENYQVIGKHFIFEKNKHIFFLHNEKEGKSEIGYMINNDCVYRTLTNSSCLGWSVTFPIHKIVSRINNCFEEIYWADKVARRYMDVSINEDGSTNFPKKLKPGSTLCDPEYLDELDCNQLKIQPNFKIPQISFNRIETGGQTISGAYQFAICYGDANGNPFTSYYSVTNPIPLANPQLTTPDFNYPVGKSIVLDVNNLDTTGQWQYFNVAVIKSINNNVTVELVGTYFIESNTRQIKYTGTDKTPTLLSVNDIFVKYPYYDTADDLTTAQDILIWKGLVSNDRINYQNIATKISLGWESYRIPPEENYATEENAMNLKSYLRDEVYAFEIVFLLRNGKQTDRFHIPGRERLPQDVIAIIDPTNPDYIGDGDPAPYYEVYNTASVEGDSASSINDSAYKGPYQYGRFAYWESSDTYPCNEDLWGDLAGQPIRHHKFPDVLVSPIFESKKYVTDLTMQMGNCAIFPIGVKIDPAQVQFLIQESNLTDAQKYDIIGFKIVRGDRATNKSIIAKGILRNVSEYRRDAKSYFYPNYPYNDLNPDPFINYGNNAFDQTGQQFVVTITALDVSIGKANVTYTDIDTNKPTQISYPSVGTYNLLSIGRPLIVTPATGTVTDASYEIWKVDATGGNPFSCSGFKVTYTNTSGVVTTSPLLRSTPSNDVITVQVKLNSGGVTCSAGCSGCVKVITKIDTIIVDADTISNGPIDITINPLLKYRQTFNSPETSFSNPYLGDILKLESAIFGKGVAHFVEVKDNAKYKLLTKEAQLDALEQSRVLADGGTGTNATAMFTAYQAYIEIYINGITRKNYAYSFNSTADYNYNAAVPNNQGIKQRKLDLASYLISGVQTIGDTQPVNNYLRESSVFLKTDSGENNSISALPFPKDTPNISALGFEENSRKTISEINYCGKPSTEFDITTLSYYGSIKQKLSNQWGQIYNYVSVDTGYQFIFDYDTASTIFGGDTFICRYAFKTKLSFFLENRVNFPNDSDVFYDEIGTIGFPKYWHSSRSILEDFNGGAVSMKGIVSYKATSFDCPNTPVRGGGTSSSFYDGYYYHFAYGIPYFYCESSINLDLRQAYDNKVGDFFPHVSSYIPDDWLQETNVPIVNDNSYFYNPSFSKGNTENLFTYIPADWTGEDCLTNYPFRAIYSDLQNTDSDNKINNWLIYRAVSYYDFPQNYGNLISIDGIQNRAVLARFENKTLLYNSLLTIDTSIPLAAYIGNNKLFTGAPPIDYAETDLGFVGTQHKFLLKLPMGPVSIDAKRGQVFLLGYGGEVKELSEFGSGMSRFFANHLDFEISNYFPEINVDNHFNNVGLHGVFDSKYDRFLITKLDYVPNDNSIIFDSSSQKFFIETGEGDTALKTQIYLTDSDYFCNKSWTISYNINTKSWLSFHSYIPNWYIGENNFFYSGLNDCCTELDFVVGEIVGNTTTTTTSSSSTSTTTSTTTTAAPLNCTIVASALFTNCNFTADGVITTPSPCLRPSGLTTSYFVIGYDTTIPPATINSTTSLIDACNAITYLNTPANLPNTTINYELVQFANLAVGETIYRYNRTNCTLIFNGWFFEYVSPFGPIVYNVVNGVIVSINNCNPTTTTTTTAAPPFYSFVINTGQIDCINGGAVLINSTPVTIYIPTNTININSILYINTNLTQLLPNTSFEYNSFYYNVINGAVSYPITPGGPC